MTRNPGLLTLASIVGIATLALAGCGSDPSLVAQFTPSATAPTPGLVKLEQKSLSGTVVTVDVLIHGPEPALDLFAFRFGIKIHDAGLVQFAPQMAYPQTALVAGAGQTIGVDVDASDPTLVRVDVEKQGGGAGNGFATASAVVIELPFVVHGDGSTTLTLTGLDNQPPVSRDSTGAVIAVTFDGASATVSGAMTGGGGY